MMCCGLLAPNRNVITSHVPQMWHGTVFGHVHLSVLLKLSKALTIQFMFGMPVCLQNGHFKFVHQGHWSGQGHR